MDSYILRIYHRDKDASGTLLGVIADINGGGDKSFSSPEELWRILEMSQGCKGGKYDLHGGQHGKHE